MTWENLMILKSTNKNMVNATNIIQDGSLILMLINLYNFIGESDLRSVEAISKIFNKNVIQTEKWVLYISNLN